MKLNNEYLLTLLKTPKIGNVSVKYINENIDSEILCIEDLYSKIEILRTKNARIAVPSFQDFALANRKAKEVINSSLDLNVKLFNINDDHYPPKLRRLPDPPVILYLKGSVDALLNDKSVAIVGTREPTDFGFRAGKRISGIFADAGFVIVSGLAKGCDTSAHLGAVERNLPTIAVLASGVDIIYPKENAFLSERILETGGALVSEYEPGTKTYSTQFVQRDRIQSGLADGLIVIETGLKGGTMHAVAAASKMKMPIGCLTGHPIQMQDHDKVKGNAHLIQQSASTLGSQAEIDSFMLKLKPDSPQLYSSLVKKEIISADPIRTSKETTSIYNSNGVEMEMLLEDGSNVSYQTLKESIQAFYNQIPKANASSVELKLLEISASIDSLLEVQKENNRLLNILISNISKDKPAPTISDSRKKKQNNQSSFL